MRPHHRASRTLALLCSLGLAVPAHAQTWSRTYGGAVSEQGLKDLAELPGGRLVVAGYTASFGGPTQASWLMNLDLSTGDVGTQRVSTSSFGGFTDGARIAADGGALFLGRDVLDIFLKHDAWMMRTDADGVVDWGLGFTRAGQPSRHFLFDAVELDDGGWIAVGTIGVLAEPPQAVWIVRVSATGTLMWQYQYGGGVADAPASITATADGNFAVAGWTNSSGSGFDDVWVMKIDGSGAILWQKTYGGKEAEQAREIIELEGGGFAVAANTGSYTDSFYAPWLLRLDANGDLLWNAVVDSDVWGDIEGVAQTRDGELAVVGRVSELGFPSNDMWSAVLAASDGTVLRQHAYEGATGDFGSVVLPLACNGFVLGGTWAWGFAGESIWLQRTDESGELGGCEIVRTTSFSFLEPKVDVADGPFVRTVAEAEVENPGLQSEPSFADVKDVCDATLPILEVSRNGTPASPEAFLPGVTTGPIISATWDPAVDHTSFLPCSIGDFMLVSAAPIEVDLGFPGTLLCNVPFAATLFDIPPSPTFDVPIPDHCGLVGVTLCAQVGSSCDGVSFQLTNALDLTIGSF